MSRVTKALRRIIAGVPLGGERVWSGDRNDLFVAHLSIYHFFGRFVGGMRVLDAGCGTGFGSKYLLEAGAASVVGIDASRAATRYARRAFNAPQLTFQEMDCQDLGFPAACFDLVVTSNVLEHLNEPDSFLAGAARCLAERGQIVVAVPPVANAFQLADTESNAFHCSNLTVTEWAALFGEHGFHVQAYRHDHPQRDAIDFTSRATTRLKPHEFTFIEATVEELGTMPTLTAIYVLTRL